MPVLDTLGRGLACMTRLTHLALTDGVVLPHPVAAAASMRMLQRALPALLTSRLQQLHLGSLGDGADEVMALLQAQAAAAAAGGRPLPLQRLVMDGLGLVPFCNCFLHGGHAPKCNITGAAVRPNQGPPPPSSSPAAGAGVLPGTRFSAARAVVSLASALHHLPDLTELSLNDEGLSQHELVALAAGLAGCPSMQRLSLTCRTLTPRGTAALAAALPAMTSLQALVLAARDMQASEAAAIVGALAGKECGRLRGLTRVVLGQHTYCPPCVYRSATRRLWEKRRLMHAVCMRRWGAAAAADRSMRHLERVELVLGDLKYDV